LAAASPGCGGVLLPKVYRQGLRIGYDARRLPNGERIPFARIEGHEPAEWSFAERIGPFSFSSAGLHCVNAWLSEAAVQTAELIIIDEVGPLELGEGGLSTGLRAVLASPRRRELYLVIRKDCLEAACARFGITGYTLIDVGTGSGTHGPGTADTE
jgi:nucleoside-triphosphatase THEP1